MKASRVYLTMVAASLAAMTLVLLVSLSGYFRAVERADTGSHPGGRLLAELENFHQQLKNIDDPEAAKRALKLFESRLGSDSEALEQAKRAFNPVLSQIASKPKEAETRYALIKKRELMEALLNAYRKDVIAKNFPLCMAYLAVLYDTQNSLLNESSEAEEVFIKRSRERINGFKPIAAETRDPAASARVAGIEAIFASLERGFDLASRWRDQRNEVLAKAEKALPKVAKEVRASGDDNSADIRRSFLYTAILSALVFLAALAALFIGHKLMKHRFEARSEALARYLREFGNEKMDPAINQATALLSSDPDWSSVLESVKDAETGFARTYQTLLSVPKSMQLPYIVFTRDRLAIHRNEAAGVLFSLPGNDAALDEIICDSHIGCRDGEAQTVIETIRNSFSTPKADSYELLVKRGTEWVPMELLSYPVSHGPIAGGRVFLFREIRSEVERIDRALGVQLERLRDFVHKITHFYPVEVMAGESDSAPLREALVDLGAMKMKLDERETLWKSEAGALVDQIERQKQVLERLGKEISGLRAANNELTAIVGAIHGTDENWHDEVNVMERDLTRWEENRQRINADLTQYKSVMGKIRAYEESLRQAVSGIGATLKDFEKGLVELRSQSEEAKVQAVNLSFTEDPALRDYSARARSHALILARYADAVEELLGSVREFVTKHPGGALYPLLESVDMDPAVIDALREEQEHVHKFLKRWQGSGAQSVQGGQKALKLLQDLARQSQTAHQLGETSLLINEQAKSNIERWN